MIKATDNTTITTTKLPILEENKTFANDEFKQYENEIKEWFSFGVNKNEAFKRLCSLMTNDTSNVNKKL